LAILALLLTKNERGHNTIKTKKQLRGWHNNKWWHPSKKYASIWETSYKKSSHKKMRTCTLPPMTETPESVTKAKGASAEAQMFEACICH
jgi:hypothetical protein